MTTPLPHSDQLFQLSWSDKQQRRKDIFADMQNWAIYVMFGMVAVGQIALIKWVLAGILGTRILLAASNWVHTLTQKVELEG